jgi:ribosomal protein S18 acetylase RimI-like enzyme
MNINCNQVNISAIRANDNIISFKCGDADLDEYIKESACYDRINKLSVTWLVHMDDLIVGFFTLANASINASLINREDGETDYPYQSYPALKIARLATRVDYQNRGIGRAMLVETLAIAEEITYYSGCRFIVVDSKKRSIGFYRKYGFKVPVSIENKIDNKTTIPLYIDLNKVSIDDE